MRRILAALIAVAVVWTGSMARAQDAETSESCGTLVISSEPLTLNQNPEFATLNIGRIIGFADTMCLPRSYFASADPVLICSGLPTLNTATLDLTLSLSSCSTINCGGLNNIQPVSITGGELHLNSVDLSSGGCVMSIGSTISLTQNLSWDSGTFNTGTLCLTSPDIQPIGYINCVAMSNSPIPGGLVDNQGGSLILGGLPINSDNAQSLDTLSFEGIATPEPSTLGLLAIGIAGLATRVWRKRK